MKRPLARTRALTPGWAAATRVEEEEELSGAERARKVRAGLPPGTPGVAGCPGWGAGLGGRGGGAGWGGGLGPFIRRGGARHPAGGGSR